MDMEQGHTETYSGSAEIGELRDFLCDLLRLNPDYSPLTLQRKRELASCVDKSFFDEAMTLVERIVDGYLSSSQKRAGGEILQEYYALLESEGHRLLEGGGLSREDEPEVFDELATVQQATETKKTTALVPLRDVPHLTRFVVLSRSQIPPLLSKAADAYRRRNMLVDTVVELAFDVLWRIDAVKAGTWFEGYLAKHEGSLDPDVIRDFLRVAYCQETLSNTLLDWTLRWCGDSQLLEHWPNVVFTGDRVLCVQAVKEWFSRNTPRNPSVAHLQLLFKRGRIDDETLLKWLESALGRLADCMLRIMSLTNSDDHFDKTQFGGALYGELKRLGSVYPLVMMVGNQLLCLPDGEQRFALAVFGLAGDGLKQWEKRLDSYCADVIRRMFILDMRAGKSPVETIRRMTFQDDDAFRTAMSHLDLVSARFDSMKERERVVDILVPFYSSFRRDKFLAMEVTRRYRVIMRMLHEDYLHDALSAEQLASVKGDGTVFDIASLMGDARKYLDRRRDKVATLEKLLASRCEFEEIVRQRRLAVIRRELFKS